MVSDNNAFGINNESRTKRLRFPLTVILSKVLKNSSKAIPVEIEHFAPGPPLTIVVVEIFTTDGDSLSARSANEFGRSAADRPKENMMVKATANGASKSSPRGPGLPSGATFKIHYKHSSKNYQFSN